MGDHAHAAVEGGHAHHWEVSWAPMCVAFGAMFLVPMVFTMYFVYQSALGAIVCAGLGTPLVLAGVAKWTHEGATQKPAIENVSPVGIGVFIIGEVLIFLGLFVSYWVMRLSAGGAGLAWPPAGTPEISKVLPAIMTVILVASSLLYHVAEGKFHDGDRKGAINWILLTLVVGVLFLGCTIYEYNHLIHEHFVPGTNQYSAAFYSLTGFHASHVLLGLCSFVAIVIAMARNTVNPLFVKVAGIYWHFVDVVWFFVASQVYYW